MVQQVDITLTFEIDTELSKEDIRQAIEKVVLNSNMANQFIKTSCIKEEAEIFNTNTLKE